MAKESLAGRERLFTTLSWDDIKLTHPIGGLRISFFFCVLVRVVCLLRERWCWSPSSELSHRYRGASGLPWNGSGGYQKLGES